MQKEINARPGALKSCTAIVSLLLLACSLLYTSCRKPELLEQKPKSTEKSSRAHASLSIDPNELIAKLPQTVLYSLGDEARFYPERMQWRYTDEGLLVRIPTTEGPNKFIYGLKRYDKPDVVNAYIVEYRPDKAFKEGNSFTGRMQWLDLQDGNMYGIGYREGKIVEQMKPLLLFPSCIETSMLERNYFYLEGDKLKVRKDNDPKVLRRGGPLDCPDNINGSDRSWWDSFWEWFKDIFKPSTETAPFEGPPGSVGGGWVSSDSNSGYDGSYSQGEGGPNPGGDGYSSGDWNNGSPNEPDNSNGPSLPTNYPLQVTYVGNNLSLSTSDRDWLKDHLDRCIEIMDYLVTAYPNLTYLHKQEIATKHLNMMMQDPGYLDFVNNFDQEYPIGKSVLELADYTFTPGTATHPVTNRNDYLRCFANIPGATYKVTLAVDQPVPNTRKAFKLGGNGNFCDVGHTFLILEQNVNGIKTVRSIGWYPQGSATPFNPIDPGVLNNDAEHDYDVALVNNIGGSDFMAIVNAIKNDPHTNYDLNDYNCTTWAYNKVFMHPMDNIDATSGYWPLGYGMNPGDMGQDIRPQNMILYSYQSILTNNQAPSNQGICP